MSVSLLTPSYGCTVRASFNQSLSIGWRGKNSAAGTIRLRYWRSLRYRCGRVSMTASCRFPRNRARCQQRPRAIRAALCRNPRQRRPPKNLFISTLRPELISSPPTSARNRKATRRMPRVYVSKPSPLSSRENAKIFAKCALPIRSHLQDNAAVYTIHRSLSFLFGE